MKFWNGTFPWRRWWCLLWISTCLQGLGFAEDLGPACAVSGMAQAHGLSVAGLAGSERMIAVRQDEVLGSMWGVVMDCLHPQWPTRIVALPKYETASAAALSMTDVKPRVVRAGDRVLLWKQDAAARIETSGAAEESGAEGQRIKVRLVRASMNGETGKEFVMGVVRGPGSVEILR